MTEFTIYIDALQEGDWFQSLSSRLTDAELVTFQSAETPPVVSELTSYDRPDIVLLRNEEPVLVLEKTSHVPTGKNPLQRIARMVKGAEMGVPGVLGGDGCPRCLLHAIRGDEARNEFGEVQR